MRKITGVFVHCTATPANWRDGQATSAKVAEVRRWHVSDRGWSDIGYHYLIDRDGTVATGRPMARDGAHAVGHNRGTIGIALFGGHGSAETDKFLDNYTVAQWQALAKLLREIWDDFGPIPVRGHNEVAAKACPGFNVGDWLVDVNAKAAKPAAPPAPTQPGWLAALLAALTRIFGGKA